MNTRPLILLLLCGCRNLVPGLPLPHGTHVATVEDITPPGANPLMLEPPLKGQAPRAKVSTPPQWPWVTNTILFQGMDTSSDYPDQWTNTWNCTALVSVDLVTWNRLPNLPLVNFHGALGFQIITNLPTLNIAAEYTPK